MTSRLLSTDSKGYQTLHQAVNLVPSSPNAYNDIGESGEYSSPIELHYNSIYQSGRVNIDGKIGGKPEVEGEQSGHAHTKRNKFGAERKSAIAIDSTKARRHLPPEKQESSQSKPYYFVLEEEK